MSASNYICRLNEETKKYAQEYLNETEDSRIKSIQELREWLEENPKIKASDEDVILLAFLRGCKFNIEKTKIKLNNYYTMRSEIPQWYSNRDPNLPEVKELVKLGVFIPLRKYYKNCLVVIIRAAAHDPKKHKQDDVFKTGMMILDVAAKEYENAQIYGVIAIFDMTGISLGHARQLTPNIIKKAVHAWQNYHCRPQQLEFIKAPLYINVILNVFKSFMSEKLKGRVKVHFDGLNSLHQVVEKEILPTEYGGSNGSLREHIDLWENKLNQYRDWLNRDEQFKTDLS